jgi:TIR domain
LRWDVALSYASAQRDYVEQVARALKARGLRCFYDADEQIDLWGRYLAEELPVVYGEQAAAVVVFISAEYVERDWTRLERRAALSRAVRERREYVLPARFDDTPLPGLLSDLADIGLKDRNPEQFARLVATKLARLGVLGSLDEAGSRNGLPEPTPAESHTPSRQHRWQEVAPWLHRPRIWVLGAAVAAITIIAASAIAAATDMFSGRGTFASPPAYSQPTADSTGPASESNPTITSSIPTSESESMSTSRTIPPQQRTVPRNTSPGPPLDTSVTAPPPLPPVFASGNVDRLTTPEAIDLDNGRRLDEEAVGMDISFSSESTHLDAMSVRVSYTVLPTAGPVELVRCEQATGWTRDYPYVYDLVEGRNICVRTDENRYSMLTITERATALSRTISFDFTTWK